MIKLRTLAPAVLALSTALPLASLSAAAMKVTLAGTQKTDADGSGTATVNLDAAGNKVCYALSVSNIAPATMAHIHRGAAGANGPPVVTLTAPKTGSSKGCVDSTKAVLDEIAANPAGYYVNVHNADFPGGAIRGQLGQ